MSTTTIAAVHRLTARWPDAPRIVTVTRKPAAGRLAHFFGDGAAYNLIIADEGISLISAHADQRFPSLANAGAAIEAASGKGLILRFVDPATFRLIETEAAGLLDAASAIWLQLRDEDAQAAARGQIVAKGFAYAMASELPPGELLAREPVGYDPAPDYTAARAARIDTLVLLDNNLTGERGHYLSVAQRIAEGARQAGIRTIWAANTRLDPAIGPAGVEVEPVFATSNFDIAKEDQATRDLSEEIVEAWRGLLDRYDSPATHFLVPTADGHFVRAAHGLLSGRKPRGVIHLATPYETRHMPSRHGGRELDWYLGEIARQPSFNRRVFLWGETMVLSALLAGRLGADVRTLPLPAPSWAAEAGMAERDGPLRIAFLGEARLDKGSLELPAIVRALLAGGSPGSVDIVVQRVPPFGGYGTDLQEAIDELGTIPGVETIDGVLSDADYHRVMLEADAILLPYRRENYAVRGSGILVEALAAGRIVLSSQDTLAKEYAGEGVVCLCSEAGDWAKAVREILDDRQAVRQNAARLGKRFCKRYAPRSYVDRLAARVEFS